MKNKFIEALFRNIRVTLPGTFGLIVLTFITLTSQLSTFELKVWSILWLVGCIAFLLLVSAYEGYTEHRNSLPTLPSLKGMTHCKECNSLTYDAGPDKHCHYCGTPRR